MQTRSTLDTSSKNLFTNIERLGIRDLLSYEQLSYDTILTSIQKYEHFLRWYPLLKYIYNLGILLEQKTKEYNELYIHLIEHNYKLITKTHAYASCLFLLKSHEVDLNSYDILLSLIKDDNLTQKIISISLERLLIVGQYSKNDIWRLYERSIMIILLSWMLSSFSAHFEELNNRLLLIAGREYYLQLTSIEQRRQFEQVLINESNPKK
ncbi:unnamed protein product, partial [Rotaria sp. Silwood1]